jgi:hypothetical protein
MTAGTPSKNWRKSSFKKMTQSRKKRLKESSSKIPRALTSNSSGACHYLST